MQSQTKLSLREASLALISVLLVAFLLFHLYALLGMVIQPDWMAAAAANTLMAAGVIWHWWRPPGISASTHFSPEESTLPAWLAFAPAAAITAGSLLIAWVSRSFGTPLSQAAGQHQWLLVTWIPLVEEIVFRAGFCHWYMQRWGRFWGIYFSSLLFAMCHADLSWGTIMSGGLGFPMGPFLLALVTGLLFARTGRLLPVILLHAACNFTVVIFSVLDARWFLWLHWLYH